MSINSCYHCVPNTRGNKLSNKKNHVVVLYRGKGLQGALEKMEPVHGPSGAFCQSLNWRNDWIQLGPLAYLNLYI